MIDPAALASLAYADRAKHIATAINSLGVDIMQTADEPFAALVKSQSPSRSTIARVLWSALQCTPDKGHRMLKLLAEPTGTPPTTGSVSGAIVCSASDLIAEDHG